MVVNEAIYCCCTAIPVAVLLGSYKGLPYIMYGMITNPTTFVL